MPAATLPEALLTSFAAAPEPGEWGPIHELLSVGGGPGAGAGQRAGAGGHAPAVCLLSAVEIRATPTTLSVAARSGRLAANLDVNPVATLVAWAGNLHYVTLALQRRVRHENVHGYRFGVQDVRIDDIGIETRPLQYRMHERLAVAERWDLTRAVLDELDG